MPDSLPLDAQKALYEGYWMAPAPPPLHDPLALTRRRFLWSLLEQADAPGRLLDCGSGDGSLVAEAAARGVEAVGIELSDAAIRRARSEHPDCTFVQHTLESRPWPVEEARFDCVVAFEVIEHLLRPEELVRGACEALRPGGYLAVTTPYHGRLKNVALALLAFDKHFDPTGEHIRFFTDGRLKQLLDENGFSVERLLHFGRFFGLWAGVFVWARKR